MDKLLDEYYKLKSRFRYKINFIENGGGRILNVKKGGGIFEICVVIFQIIVAYVLVYDW